MSPTSAANEEVLRRLEEFRQETRQDFRELRESLAADYVRKDVQDRTQAATDLQLRALEEDQHLITKRLDRAEDNATALKRIVLTAVVGGVTTLIVALILYGAHVQ